MLVETLGHYSCYRGLRVVVCGWRWRSCSVHLNPRKWETLRMVYLGSTLRSFTVIKPFVFTLMKASRKGVEARNLYCRKIRMYVTIWVTAVNFGTILDRKRLPPSRVVGKSDATPAISHPGSTKQLLTADKS
jgi:hypothetical protein